MNLNSKLIKLIDKVSNDQCLNFQYSIEHIMIELNKIYQLELIEQKRFTNKTKLKLDNIINKY